MTEITLHGFAPSTYTRTARMAAAEKGVAHQLVPVAYGKPEHLALHPFGKMPAMTHERVTVFETLAIVAYLDRSFGGPRLIPEDAAAQVQTLAAISVAIDYAYGPLVQIEKRGDALDPEQLAAAAKIFDWLEAMLGESAFLSGSSLGAADLFFVPMLDFHRQQAGSAHVVAGRASLAAWLEAMSRRPAFAETAAS